MKNSTALEGNLTQDPKTGSGPYGLWAKFTLASTAYYNKQEFTQFIPCWASGKTAEIISNYKKGDRLLTFGRMKGRWDKDEKRSDVSVDVKLVYLISEAKKKEELPKSVDAPENLPF